MRELREGGREIEGTEGGRKKRTEGGGKKKIVGA